jgi:hypothetical protein
MASRPLSGSAARRVWRPLLRAACRSAASCSHSSRRREQRFVVDEINAALRGMGLRIVEPRASRGLLCAAELALATATDDAHHRRGVFIIKHFRLNACWFGTRHLTTTMFSFLVTSCFTLVAAQLELSQHTALMDLYDALGSNRQTTMHTCVANEQKQKTKNIFFSLQVVPLHCARASRRLHGALAVV